MDQQMWTIIKRLCRWQAASAKKEREDSEWFDHVLEKVTLWNDKCEPFLWDQAGGRLHLNGNEETDTVHLKLNSVKIWNHSCETMQVAGNICNGGKSEVSQLAIIGINLSAQHTKMLGHVWIKVTWFTWKRYGVTNYCETKQVACCICSAGKRKWAIGWDVWKKVTCFTWKLMEWQMWTIVVGLSRWQAASAWKCLEESDMFKWVT
jgi:hypothetical protein